MNAYGSVVPRFRMELRATHEKDEYTAWVRVDGVESKLADVGKGYGVYWIYDVDGPVSKVYSFAQVREHLGKLAERRANELSPS